MVMWQEIWIFELTVTLHLFIRLKWSFHQKSYNSLPNRNLISFQHCFPKFYFMLNLDVNYDFTIAFKWDEIITNEHETARHSSYYFPAELR